VKLSHSFLPRLHRACGLIIKEVMKTEVNIVAQLDVAEDRIAAAACE